jgi:hypothetical protein
MCSHRGASCIIVNPIVDCDDPLWPMWILPTSMAHKVIDDMRNMKHVHHPKVAPFITVHHL